MIPIPYYRDLVNTNRKEYHKFIKLLRKQPKGDSVDKVSTPIHKRGILATRDLIKFDSEVIIGTHYATKHLVHYLDHMASSFMKSIKDIDDTDPKYAEKILGKSVYVLSQYIYHVVDDTGISTREFPLQYRFGGEYSIIKLSGVSYFNLYKLYSNYSTNRYSDKFSNIFGDNTFIDRLINSKDVGLSQVLIDNFLTCLGVYPLNGILCQALNPDLIETEELKSFYLDKDYAYLIRYLNEPYYTLLAHTRNSNLEHLKGKLEYCKVFLSDLLLYVKYYTFTNKNDLTIKLW